MSISTGLYPTLDLWNVNKITITITIACMPKVPERNSASAMSQICACNSHSFTRWQVVVI
jgi:hypothetical protein